MMLSPDGSKTQFLLDAGFHIGFLFVALSVIKFVDGILSRPMIEEGRVPWFFGFTLVSTFFQVLLWVHGFMHVLPEVYTYALMVIASGGLILFAEQRSSQLMEKKEYGKESFM